MYLNILRNSPLKKNPYLLHAFMDDYNAITLRLREIGFNQREKVLHHDSLFVLIT